MRLQVTFENICKMFVSRDPSPLTDKISMVVCFHKTRLRRRPSHARPRQAEPRAWLRAHVRLSRARPRRFLRHRRRTQPPAAC